MNVELECSAMGTSRQNEDAIGHEGPYAWVIDGASAVFPDRFFARSDSAYLADALSHELRDFVRNEDGAGLSLSHMLQACLQRVRAGAKRINPDFELAPSHLLPSFAIALVREAGEHLDYYFLCDCSLLQEGRRPITDGRFQAISARHRGIVAQRGIAADRHAKLALYQETRRTLNQPNGYWVGTLDAKGIGHGVSGRVAIGPNDRFALCSDGFFEYFIEEGIDPSTWRPTAQNALAGLDVLYHNSLIDPYGEHTARPKGRDDASVIIFTT